MKKKANQGFAKVPNKLLELIYGQGRKLLALYDIAVLFTLIRFSIGYIGDRSKNSYDAKVTHSFIANATGIARSNVSRSMKKLAWIGWVRKIKKGLYRLTILESIFGDTIAQDLNVSSQIQKGISGDTNKASTESPNIYKRKPNKEMSSEELDLLSKNWDDLDFKN